MFSLRAQWHFCTSLFLLGVALYIVFYFRIYLDTPLLSYQGSVRTDIAEPTSNFTLSLDPAAHVHRQPATLQFQWNITSDFRAPDGVTKRVYLINGEFPGPLIEARSGDELIIEIYNGLSDDEGTAIHWHGLTLRSANDMDGVAGLTQSSIAPSEHFTYRFKIGDDEAGTFWYHAHSDLQRADGLYGPLIIHSPAKDEVSHIITRDYDEDLVIMIGDWYHQSGAAVQEYYTDYRNFKIEPAPDSLLINGKGFFNCSMATPARPLECAEISVPSLVLSKPRTRLRIINTGAISGFSISMVGYDLTPIEIDGGNAVMSTLRGSEIGVLYPGERVDLIVTHSGTLTDNPQFTIELDPENLRFKNFALTPKQHFPIVRSKHQRTKESPTDHPVLPYLSLANLSGPPIKPENEMDVLADETILLYSKIAYLAEFSNRAKGFVNRTSWDLSEDAGKPLIEIDRKAWEGEYFIPEIHSESVGWVDVVLNNMDDKGHPFHFHGHTFYILSTHRSEPGSYDAYNPFDTTAAPAGGPMNMYNPTRKDTVYVPAMGYVVLRFKADNVGLWFFHCHVLWHHAAGMAMAFQVV